MSAAYVKHNTYWSNRQAEVRPSCFVTPRNTKDVSAIVKTLVSLNAPFTVKAGGHTSFEGASNIENGVTIDLVYLNQITLTNQDKSLSLGPGARWIDVSRRLDQKKLAVVGGRAADVGVAGLILGGGISYFSEERGWACDNIKNFEVVLASGQIVNASPSQNSDLYRALRGGGGSNFGIVTRFDIVAFPQGDLWTQTMIHPFAAREPLISNYFNLVTKGLLEDRKTHTYLGFGYQEVFGGYITLASFYRSVPPPVNTIPKVFQPFQSVEGALFKTSLVTNVSTLSLAIDEPYGTRATWWDTTVQVKSPALFQEIATAWQVSVSKLKTAMGSSTMTPFLIYQPISKNVIGQMQKQGGNALGLKTNDCPLMIVQLHVVWADKKFDDLVEATSKDFLSQVKQMANKRGEYKGLVYMNYGGKTQDVLKSYGKESYSRLRETAKKWDPKGTLPKLWTGYFQF